MIPNLYRTRAALAVALLTVCTAPSRAEGPADDLYARTLRGTALVLTPKGTGTGWVIDLKQGVLVTNEHVVTTHEQVEVIFPTYGKDGRPVAERSHYRRNAPRYAADVIDADGPREPGRRRSATPCGRPAGRCPPSTPTGRRWRPGFRWSAPARRAGARDPPA